MRGIDVIKDNQTYFNRLHVLIDAIVIVLSYVCAWAIQFHVLRGEKGMLPVETYMSALVFVLPVFLLLYYAFNLYTPKRVQGRRLEASNVFVANVMGMLIFILGLYLIKEDDFSRRMIFLFIGLNIFLTLVERNIIRAVLRNIRSIDKSRIRIREILTGKRHGDASGFDLTVNATHWNIKHLAPVIAEFAARWFEEQEVQTEEE